MTALEISWPEPPVMAAIVTALAMGLVAWLSWLGSGAKELRERLDTLEARVATLEKEKAEQGLTINAMASFINRLGQWIEGGMRGRRPRPSSRIHNHIDTDPWEVVSSGMSPYSPPEEDTT